MEIVNQKVRIEREESETGVDGSSVDVNGDAVSLTA